MIGKFYSMSGLKVNFYRSEIFCSNSAREQTHLTGLLGLKVGNLPVRYLGVPLVSGKLRDQDCQPLMGKLQP